MTTTRLRSVPTDEAATEWQRGWEACRATLTLEAPNAPITHEHADTVLDLTIVAMLTLVAFIVGFTAAAAVLA